MTGFVKTKGVQYGKSTTATDNFVIQQPTSPDGSLRISNGNIGATTDLVTVTSAGNVGIGTSSPNARFEVFGASNSEYLRIGGDDTGNNNRALRFTSSSTGAGPGARHTINASSGGGEIAFATASTTRMLIDQNGAQSSVIPGGTTLLPEFKCRAWVNFDGVTGSGNTIRASGNVSSVTRTATGEYTVNFTTAMPDANYAALVNGELGRATGSLRSGNPYEYNTGNVKMQVLNIITTTSARIDVSFANVAIFR